MHNDARSRHRCSGGVEAHCGLPTTHAMRSHFKPSDTTRRRMQVPLPGLPWSPDVEPDTGLHSQKLIMGILARGGALSWLW